MISAKPVKSASSASSYFFDADNYYLTDKSEIREASTWFGEGAKRLGIEGNTINERLFSEMLGGLLPNGEQIGLMRDGSIKHRPATDITLSANKSISTMSLVGGDDRLADLHDRAVDHTLKVAERLYASARKTVDGVTSFEKTANLVIAKFNHSSSRECEPQKHTHAVVMNVTQREDGNWRALGSAQPTDADNFAHDFRRCIMDNLHYLGAIYNSVVAKGTVDLGYDIEVVDKYGNFKIKDLPDSYLESQSTRRQQILDRLKEKGESGGKAAQVAALDSRKQKVSVDPHVLREAWKRDAKAQGVDFDQIIKASKEKGTGEREVSAPIPVVSATDIDAVNDAIAHLSEYSISLSHGDIIRQAFSFGGGTIEHEALEQVVSDKIKSGDLIGKHQIAYTSKALLEQERAFKNEIKQSKGSSYAIDIRRSGPIAKILASTDRLHIVNTNGLKHEAKFIEAMVQKTEGQGLNAYVLHHNLSSLNRLRDDINRKQASGFWAAFKSLFAHDLMQTISHFKHEYGLRVSNQFLHRKSQDVIFVTDAQKLSYDNTLALNRLAQAGDAKVVFLNNTKATEDFSPGSAIRVMREAGICEHQSSTRALKGRVRLIESKQSDHTVATAYMQAGGTVPVVAKTNKDVANISVFIRSQMREAGLLSSKSFSINTLSTRSLSDVQKQRAKFYAPGDQVTFHAFTREQETWYVSASDHAKNTLSLGNTKGDKRILDLSTPLDKATQVKKAQKISVAAGERLRANRHIYLGDERIDKNTTFSITSINNEGMRVQYADKSLWIDKKRLTTSFIDLGYVIKPHQLTDTDKVITKLNGYQVSAQSLGELREYVPNITLVTDNEAKTQKLLDQARISWVASEVASGKVLYEPLVRTDTAIQKDLETVASALLGNNKNTLETALSYASAKLAEREAGFSFEALAREALFFAVGEIDHVALEQLIQQKRAQGQIMGADLLTTKQIFELEQSILANNSEGKGQVSAIVDKVYHLPDYLTRGQRDAVELSLTSKDRFVGVQGLAGTGKTTMMKVLRERAEQQGYRIIGIAPTHKAVDKLDESLNTKQVVSRFERAGIEVMTAHAFLNKDAQDFNSKTIFIADEASMLGNRMFHNIQKQVLALNARAIYSGDTEQQNPIDNGKPFELSLKHGLNHARMDKILRQRNAPDLKEAVELAAQGRDPGKASAALKKINSINPQAHINRSDHKGLDDIGISDGATHSYIEVPPERDEDGNVVRDDNGIADLSPLYRAAAHDYLTRVPEQRARTLVIATMHESREQITSYIREGLKQEGMIKNDTDVYRLKSKNLDQAQLLHVNNFQTQDVLKFDASYSVMRRGDHMRVVDIKKKTNQLVLEDMTSKERYTINPALIAHKAQMSVYESVYTQLGEGDRIRLRVSDIARGRKGGDEYVVKSIEGNTALLASDKLSFEIDLTAPQDQHWDHAYTNTTFSVQGDDDKYAIAVGVNENFRTTYIPLSRAKHHVMVYTDNKNKLEAQVSDLTRPGALKLSAIEVIDQGERQQADKQTEQKPKQAKEASKADTNRKPTEDKPQYREKFIRAEDVKPKLDQRIGELALALKGDPNSSLSNGSELRYGNKGSFAVYNATGRWHDFESDTGGDALALIKHELGNNARDFKDVIAYAASFLGIGPEMQQVPIAKPKAVKTPAPDKHASKVDYVDYARRLVSQALPLAGSVGERYLHNRGLFNIAHSDVKYLPSLMGKLDSGAKIRSPAIIAYARDEEGKVNHAQVIRITPDGQKNLDVALRKQTYGSINGRAVILNHHADKLVSYLVEGPETGFAILQANKKAQVLATLGKGNYSKVDLDQLAPKVVVCLDNDGVQSIREKALQEAIDRIEQSGREVYIIMPEAHKQDFNDVLQQKGQAELERQINNVIMPQELKDVVRDIAKLHLSDDTPINLSDAIARVGDDNKLSQLDFGPGRTDDNRLFADLFNKDKVLDQDAKRHLNEHSKEQLKDQIERDQVENVVDRYKGDGREPHLFKDLL